MIRKLGPYDNIVFLCVAPVALCFRQAEPTNSRATKSSAKMSLSNWAVFTKLDTEKPGYRPLSHVGTRPFVLCGQERTWYTGVLATSTARGLGNLARCPVS